MKAFVVLVLASASLTAFGAEPPKSPPLEELAGPSASDAVTIRVRFAELRKSQPEAAKLVAELVGEARPDLGLPLDSLASMTLYYTGKPQPDVLRVSGELVAGAEPRKMFAGPGFTEIENRANPGETKFYQVEGHNRVVAVLDGGRVLSFSPRDLGEFGADFKLLDAEAMKARWSPAGDAPVAIAFGDCFPAAPAGRAKASHRLLVALAGPQRSAVVAITFGRDLTASVVFTGEPKAQGAEFRTSADSIAGELRAWAKARPDAAAKNIVLQTAAALAGAKFADDGKSVAVKIPFDVKSFRAGIDAMAATAREASYRVASQGNLKQIGVAALNYADVHNRYPGEIRDAKTAKPLLSWRVAFLPYLEQQRLYDEFKLDESWDSEHNRKLIPKMPRIFLLPGEKNVGRTRYRMFSGCGALLGEEKNTPKDVGGDGATGLMVFEAAEAAEWTRPEGVPFDPDADVAGKFYCWSSGVCHAATVSAGVVAFRPGQTPEKALKAFVRVIGGDQKFSLDDLAK